MTIFDEIRQNLESRNDRSAWNRGVNDYALELLESVAERAEDEKREPENVKELRAWMLNGADDWAQYSWGGSALIYNGDIAERLCTPSELKRTNGGAWRPSRDEEWLDVQARALWKAANRVASAYVGIKHAIA